MLDIMSEFQFLFLNYVFLCFLLKVLTVSPLVSDLGVLKLFGEQDLLIITDVYGKRWNHTTRTGNSIRAHEKSERKKKTVVRGAEI